MAGIQLRPKCLRGAHKVGLCVSLHDTPSQDRHSLFEQQHREWPLRITAGVLSIVPAARSEMSCGKRPLFYLLPGEQNPVFLLACPRTRWMGWQALSVRPLTTWKRPFLGLEVPCLRIWTFTVPCISENPHSQRGEKPGPTHLCQQNGREAGAGTLLDDAR